MLAEAAATTALLFSFQDPRVAESSSLVSTPAGDWLWTANDSGDSARLFAVDRTGRTLAVASLPGTRVVDVEDTALGPDRTLYLADIGDNRSERAGVVVLRVPEPAVDPGRLDVRLATAPPVRTVLTYDDGPHDAETLLVHPRTGQVLVVTKGVLGSGVYAAPLPLADGVLRRVGGLTLRGTGTPGGPDIGGLAQVLATGGAVSPDGRRVVVRTYTDAYVWQVPGDDLAAALRGRPTVLALPETRQGEAVTWSRAGDALLTSSEGRGAPVWQVAVPAALPGAAQPVPAASSAAPGSTTPAARPAASGRHRSLLPALWALPVAALLVVGLRRARRRHR